MHKLAIAEMVKSVRRRIEQGDCPTEAPFSREQLEDALVTLADEFERLAPGRLRGLPDAEWLRKKVVEDPDVDTEAGRPITTEDLPPPDNGTGD